ncbi:MAG: hypothetical protein ACM3SR_18935 [Ignavibacteriales bacterium]
MKTKVELHIVIDREGVRSVQIIGPSEVHPEGHDLYFQIRDLILELDRQLQERFRSSTKGETKQ